jgi:hypothetical protein
MEPLIEDGIPLALVKVTTMMFPIADKAFKLQYKLLVWLSLLIAFPIVS